MPGMPDIGVLSAHLLSSFQKELFTRLTEAGHEHLRPRHGAIMAYIAADGTRASELSERSGQHKQVVPTERGRDQMTRAATIIADIEARFARQVGPERFAVFKEVFAEITTDYR
jgi:hypothetical protein